MIHQTFRFQNDHHYLIPFSNAAKHQYSAAKLGRLEAIAEFRPVQGLDELIAVRSSHEHLSQCKDVFFNGKKRAWFVKSCQASIRLPVYILNYGVHIVPQHWQPRPFMSQGHRLGGPGIDSGKLPSDEDLLKIREANPGSTGVNIMIGGGMDVLFDSDIIPL